MQRYEITWDDSSHVFHVVEQRADANREIEVVVIAKVRLFAFIPNSLYQIALESCTVGHHPICEIAEKGCLVLKNRGDGVYQLLETSGQKLSERFSIQSAGEPPRALDIYEFEGPLEALVTCTQYMYRNTISDNEKLHAENEAYRGIIEQQAKELRVAKAANTELLLRLAEASSYVRKTVQATERSKVQVSGESAQTQALFSLESETDTAQDTGASNEVADVKRDFYPSDVQRS